MEEEKEDFQEDLVDLEEVNNNDNKMFHILKLNNLNHKKTGGRGGGRTNYTPAEADFIFSQFFGGGNPFGGSFGRAGGQRQSQRGFSGFGGMPFGGAGMGDEDEEMSDEGFGGGI